MKKAIDSVYKKYSYYYFRMIEIICRALARIYPIPLFDRVYCSVKYIRILNEKLNLKHPQAFTEKIQWLKLYDRNPSYTQLADKYAVRKYVENCIGKQYLNDLLGVYSSIGEIDFEQLPDKFILKATHGCGWNIICNDKGKLNVLEAKAKLHKWLRMNWYYMKGEWVYKNIPPRIISERYLEGDKPLGLIDYKFYCFHGDPKYILAVVDRFGNRMDFYYDMEWIIQPFSMGYAPPPHIEIPRPAHLNLMVELARKLSSGINFSRVDLYNINGSIIFGEITFYSDSGFEIINPREFDYKFGTYLNLPNESR